MKSFFVTLLCVLGVAYAGAFFEFWPLPFLPADHLTAKDAGERLGHLFDFTDDLREIREDVREKNEDMFVKKR